MYRLNYQHLRYFWTVCRHQHLTRASAELHLTPQTVSSQIRDLEEGLGAQLFLRQGRRLVITDVGHTVFRYADKIFGIGEELQDAVRAFPTNRPLRFSLGVVEVIPKLVAHRLIQPIYKMGDPVHIICREGNLKELLSELSIHNLDVVLSDSPIPSSVKVKAYNHQLGECDVKFVANRSLADSLRSEFPDSLDGAPLLVPVKGTRMRQELDAWFDARSIHPTIVGEFDDSALLKVFGQGGNGFFAVPSVILSEVIRQYQVEMIGAAEGIVESFYAISGERRIQHPAVEAICKTSRSQLFDFFSRSKRNAEPDPS